MDRERVQHAVARHLRGVSRMLVVTLGAVAAVGLSAPTASADECTQASCAGSGGNGYQVSISVTLSGDGAPGGGGGSSSVSASVAPVCYWYNQSANLRAATIAQLAANTVYDGDTRLAANDAVWDNPPEAFWEGYIEREAQGQQLVAYEPTCQDGNSNSGGDLNMLNDYGLATSPYGLYIGAVGSEPAPVLDPLTLVQVAEDNLDLGSPTVDHNPRATALNGGTFVGLPTYFWVDDPRSLGGADGQLTIRATVSLTGDWAEVTAENGGLTLTSPAGGADCSRAQGLTRYGDAGDPCVVEFARASIGGAWPVTAVSAWNAAFETSAGDTGALDAKTSTAPALPVPVGEAQALVNRTR